MGSTKQFIHGYNYLYGTLILIFLFSALPAQLHAQDTEYEKWKKQQEAEFKEYQDKFDKEFIEMLEKTWKEVGIKQGSDFYKDKKLIEYPKAPPKPAVKNIAPKDEAPIGDRIDIDIPDAPVPEPIKIEKPKSGMFGDMATKSANISYFASTVPFEYPAQLRTLFTTREFSMSKTDNKKIAEFWDKVSRIDHRPIIAYANELRQELKLNDWGYVLLLNDFANTVYKGYDQKLVNLYNWFLLTRAGYQVRIGYDQNNVYLLFAVKYNVFNTKYYTLDGQRYYVIDLNENKQTPSSIFTYAGSHKGQNKKLDFRITEFPNLGDTRNLETRTLQFSFNGTDYSIPVSIDKNLITYFQYYPLTELPVFFTASFSETSKKSMYEKLAPVIKEMTEEEAVNFLLRFVQTAFDYKTDQDQFDREKYMIPEETLFYPYSDCDDRAIFFANLVQDLVGLNVVGVRYSKHLATAVAFSNNDVDGDFYYSDGKKYVIADPTYINAVAGMTMPQFKNEKPEIIPIK
jgi:hypothetical protein